MTRYDVPRDEDGRRLCEHCLKNPVPKSLGSKPRKYCSRNCVQRAYEARRTREAIVTSVAVAVARDRKSREVRPDGRGNSRDFPKPQVAPEIPAPAPGGDFLLAPPVRPKRRRLLPPPPAGRRAVAPTLFEAVDADGE